MILLRKPSLLVAIALAWSALPVTSVAQALPAATPSTPKGGAVAGDKALQPPASEAAPKVRAGIAERPSPRPGGTVQLPRACSEPPMPDWCRTRSDAELARMAAAERAAAKTGTATKGK
jgi:hypothetical protein